MFFKNKGVQKEVHSNEWFGIHFSEVFKGINNLESNKHFFGLSQSIFFDEFYRHFFLKYSEFSDVNKEWRAEKDIHVKHISSEIKKNNFKNILSFGCGIGYIESQLLKNGKHLIDCYDVTEACFIILKKNYPNARYFSDIKKLDKYDFIYANQVFYSLDSDECVLTLKNLSNILNPNGKILIIEPSPNPIDISNEVSIIKMLKYKVGLVVNPIRFRFFKRANPNRGKDFIRCGWRRDRFSYKEIFEKSGLAIHNQYPISNSRYYLIGKLNG